MQTLKLTNKKLLELLRLKDNIVKDGRKISQEIEELDKEITKCEEEEREITAKVEPIELGEQAEKLKNEINKQIKKFEALAKKIKNTKLDAIPKDLEAKHKDLMAKKEKLERDRNKIALKVQKIKDRVVPIIQKEVKPKLEEFEDIETAELEGSEVVVKTFSYLEEWKKAYRDKNKKE